jgi:hypothetical protein
MQSSDSGQIGLDLGDMPASRSNRIRWTVGVLLALGVLTVALWPSRPERIIAMAAFHEQRGEEGEANGRRMRDRLIGCGSSAIGPTIEAIRRHSAWNRRYAYLPQVLKGLGEPARGALLSAIDSERDANARAYLISALQDAFSDYSQFGRWLADASNGVSSSFQIVHFASGVRRSFPVAPELEAGGRLSPEFAEWWRTNNQVRP